jgi:U3 small nucleolar RNA-associated protein 19
VYYGLKIIASLMSQLKSILKKIESGTSSKEELVYNLIHLKLSDIKCKEIVNRFEVSKFIQNAFDFLRIISIPDSNSTEDDLVYLVDRNVVNITEEPYSDDEASQDSDHEENLFEGNETTKQKQQTLKKTNKFSSNSISDDGNKKKSTSSMSTTEQMRHIPHYKKLFSKAWLLYLSLPLSKPQHKLALRHLAEYVIPYLTHPLLLADYLTRSYQEGGMVAVLALGKCLRK